MFNVGFMLMLYFKLGQYGLTQYDSLCSGTFGKRSIDTLESCQNSVDFVQKVVPLTSDSVTEEENFEFPKGCYVTDTWDAPSEMFFNTAHLSAVWLQY